MTNIVLIPCASKKQIHRAKAKDIYISPLFRMNLKYAQSLHPDRIFILSAKHGLLALDEEIEPYDKTLNTMNSQEIKEWANNLLQKLRKVADLEIDKFIILAGDKYRKYVIPHIKNYETPLQGLSIGKQLQYLKRKTK